MYTFNPRWKEELVCQSSQGTLIIEMTMGISHVYAPDRRTWNRSAPGWAKPDYDAFMRDLTAWCEAEHLPLTVDSDAWLTAEPEP